MTALELRTWLEKVPDAYIIQTREVSMLGFYELSPANIRAIPEVAFVYMEEPER